MAFSLVVLETKHTAADVVKLVRPATKNRAGTLQRLAYFILSLGKGARRGVVTLKTGAVKATATISITGNITATDTFVLNGVTFTARASGAVGNEFNITSGDVTATAASVVAFVNASASTDVTDCIVASSALGVVTFTALVPGKAGNGFTLSESLTNATRVDFASGSDGTTTVLTAGGAS